LLCEFRNGLSTKRCTGGYDPIAPFTVYAGAPARSINLTTAFVDPDASNAVQLSVSLPSSTGTFTIALDG
jgi:hypothetical protein